MSAIQPAGRPVGPADERPAISRRDCSTNDSAYDSALDDGDNNMTSKRVLISGLSGFTGRYLRAEFMANGWQVYGFGRQPSAEPDHYQLSLDDLPGLLSLIDKTQPHVFVHLAGVAYPAHHSPIDFYNIHVQGTFNILTALKHKAKTLQKVLLASSAYVYGGWVSGLHDEASPLRPANDYGVSKLAMEYMSWLWREDLPIVISRSFNYTGRGQSEQYLISKIVAHFKRRERNIELGNTHVMRDFSDVRDICRSMRLLVENRDSKGAVNICSETSHCASEVVDLCQKITNHDIAVTINSSLVRKNEVKTLYGSRQRLEAYTGKTSRISLEDTLRWMLD
jgi:GDP-6-deoxy-D-talose 4-dehydrogenase